uniref:Uncharacterized protein n=1 Tax=Candidatus Kentrum sp. LPFa TaxID=2126335 RepID=A0A450W0Y2_9GAMM|nr:MAG: hypothetical protein BECKLPF1236B_GA0070989_101512 [Candidatus Kentron sp. LPFa]
MSFSNFLIILFRIFRESDYLVGYPRNLRQNDQKFIHAMEFWLRPGRVGYLKNKDLWGIGACTENLPLLSVLARLSRILSSSGASLQTEKVDSSIGKVKVVFQ